MSRPVVVALHGVGATAADLGRALHPLQAVADVITLPAPHPYEGGGSGRQWFSIAGVTEANRADRVAGALPPLIARLESVAAEHGVARDDLVLLGFSQGAILTLAAIATGLHRGAAVAIAGRLAVPVKRAGEQPARLLLVHDRHDRVMPEVLSEAAGAALSSAGHEVTRAATEGLGHSIGPPTLDAISKWLSTLSRYPALAGTLKG